MRSIADRGTALGLISLAAVLAGACSSGDAGDTVRKTSPPPS